MSFTYLEIDFRINLSFPPNKFDLPPDVAACESDFFLSAGPPIKNGK